MIFSKACEYGIRAVVYIASASSEMAKVGINEVCTHIHAPQHFTAKILQELSRKQVISSQKGLNGGFFLDVNQKAKPIKEIVEAIDGGNVFTGCGLGLRECSESKPCPLHDQFKAIRASLTDMMANTTIQELALKLQRGETVLGHS